FSPLANDPHCGLVKWGPATTYSLQRVALRVFATNRVDVAMSQFVPALWVLDFLKILVVQFAAVQNPGELLVVRPPENPVNVGIRGWRPAPWGNADNSIHSVSDQVALSQQFRRHREFEPGIHCDDLPFLPPKVCRRVHRYRPRQKVSPLLDTLACLGVA